MIVDASALVAILYKEPEGPGFLTSMLTAPVRISAVTLFEFGMVVDSLRNEEASRTVDLILTRIEAEVVAVDAETARMARAAYKRFGKKNHPAKLNFGDCFPYALAKVAGEPLLFKGNDFAQTDVVSAV
ncbi:type II toxin-antitoxin system VapC family toxin [Brevundimonas sp. TWP2-3-4b1]|uniref:type II toxin-antitoxin system VapC family toxin n=1 Tax=Brevundimonas sp. TWP2-3-4b1 TaxID=2804580 RepID=UPI003CEC4C07